MVNSPQFQLWLRIETGRLAISETKLAIPPEELKYEVRSGGRWVQVAEVTNA